VLSPAEALWRRRWLAAVVLVLVLTTVGVWLKSMRREYTASATLTATPARSLLQSTGNFDNLETTLAQLANSHAVLADARKHMRLRRTIDQLRSEVSGVRVTGTVLIRVTVTDADPHAAADIADAVASVLPEHDPSRGLFTFTLSDPAVVPSTPSSPNVKIVLLAGAALAILLAAGVAIGYERVAGRIETPRQLALATGSDVVGVVTCPRRPSPRPPWEDGISHDPGFRSLKAALETATDDETLSPVVLTGLAADRALCEWVAWNLSLTLAEARYRVLLVDADLDRSGGRRGSFGCNSPGLFGVLADDVPVDAAVCPTSVEELSILPAGDPSSEQPVGPVRDLRFAKLLSEVADRFDVVVVLTTSAESARIVSMSGSLLLVVAAGRVPVWKVHRMRDMQSYAQSRHALHTVLVRREGIRRA
jgi:capsular polysaccharide biosynthesis protein